MKSGLKTALAIALLIAAVFGVTVISQLSPASRPTPSGAAPGSPAEIPPIAYRYIDTLYDPTADLETNYHYRLFNGFFEIGTGGNASGPRNWVGFALLNKRPTPALLAPLSRSCTKCTSARAMTLPDAAIQSYAMAAAAGNFFSIGGTPNPLTAIAWAEQVGPANWFNFDFENPKGTFAIPGAPRPESPTWAILELDFKVSMESGPTKVAATFDLLDSKLKKLRSEPLLFSVTYAQRPPYEVWPKDINVGEMPEGIAPRTFDVFAFSMTRDRDRLVPPAVIVNGNDPTVSVAAPVPMSAEDCERLAVRLTHDFKGAVRVAGGYRYAVTVLRQPPGQPPDVGEFEKGLQFASNLTSHTYAVAIKGTVTGDLRLDGVAKIDFGSYESAFRAKKEARLVTDKPEMELELVPERCEPKFVQLALSPPETASGRKTWTLTATIAEQQGRQNWSGVVMLRTVGPHPVTFRFPIAGHGH